VKDIRITPMAASIENIKPPPLLNRTRANEPRFKIAVSREKKEVISPVGKAARFDSIACNLNARVTNPKKKNITPVMKNTIGAKATRIKKSIPDKAYRTKTAIRSMISITIRTADRAMFISASRRLAMAMPPTPLVYARLTNPITVV